MPNGKSGDHPRTDLLLHGADVFSPEADRLIREIVRVGGEEELDGLFDWFNPPGLPQLQQDIQAVYDRLLIEAKARGWDTSAPLPGALPVEELLRTLEVQARGMETVELWVPDQVLLANQLIANDVAIAIITDKALELGLEPMGFELGDRGRTNKYKKLAV